MEVATTVEQQSETRDIFHFTVNTIWQAVDVLLGIEQINSARERAQASKDLDNDASVISAELYQAHALESALGTTVFALNPIVPEPTAQAAVRRDFDLLLAASEEFDWTDGTPVPPEFFGPLWPEGEPEGWPRPEPTDDHHSEPPVLKLEIAVPEGMDSAATQAFDAKVAELLAAMSAFDAAMGGHGLKILDECSNEPLRLDDESPIHEDNLVGVGGAI